LLKEHHFETRNRIACDGIDCFSTDAQRAQYWRAQAEVLAAQTAAQRAAQAFEVTLKGLQEYCGPTQELQSVNGEPFCKLKKTEASSAAR